MVALTGILKKNVVISVADEAPPVWTNRSTSPSRSQSPQATPWPFCKWAVPEEPRYQQTASPPTFLNIRFGNESGEIRVAGAQVHVEPAVVVKVAIVASHGRENHVQARFLGHVSKPLPCQIPVKPAGIPAVGLAEQSLDDVAQGAVVAGGEDVEPAVVIKVPGPAREAVIRPVNSHRGV